MFSFFFFWKNMKLFVNYWILHSPELYFIFLPDFDDMWFKKKSSNILYFKFIKCVDFLFSIITNWVFGFQTVGQTKRAIWRFEDAILALCNCDLKRSQKWKWLVVSVLMKIGFRHEKCLMLLQNCSLVLTIWSKTKTLRCEKTCRMSTKSFDLSSSFFLQFVVAFDLWQQGQGGWVTLLGAGRGQGKSLGLGHKLMKVSNLDTRVN